MSGNVPTVDKLIHRLAETPQEFLAPPMIRGRGVIVVEAVVNDLVMDLGGKPLLPSELKSYRGTSVKARNRLRLILAATWLLHDRWFRQQQRFAEPAKAWLRSGLDQLAGLVAADLFVTDADRREELARLCLAALALVPQGETGAQAEDRLHALGSVARNHVIQEMKEKERRAREVRKKMREKRAREAAAKANREW
ncbi:MAG: hypothetical protein GY731_07485 [Gammaproteobacteria bacterium]|nr:hypothetical protein [Gammaproteobacteria bacterium]